MGRLQIAYVTRTKQKLFKLVRWQHLWEPQIGFLGSMTTLEGVVDQTKCESWVCPLRTVQKCTLSWKQPQETSACVTYVGHISSEVELLSEGNENRRRKCQEVYSRHETRINNPKETIREWKVIQGSRKRDKVGWQEFLNHLLKKRITVWGKKWHSLLETPKNRKAKRTNVRTLGHRKCYDSDSPGKPWRRWGTAILNARIYLDLQMGGRGLGWTVGEGGAEERNGLTEPLPRACLFTAHHRHWGWAPAILKTHLTPSCSSCLMLPSIAICYLEGWTSLFPRNFPCSDLTFWELELTNNWYPCSYYRTKQTLISFVFILIIRSSNSCVRFIHLSHMEKEKLCLTCAFGGFHVGSHRRQNWYLRDAIQGGSDNRKQ